MELHALSLTLIVLVTENVRPASSWERSALIYHMDGRTTSGWQQNFMRVNSDGSFTGQWLWDHAIISTSSVEGTDIFYGGLSGQQFQALLNILRNDTLQLDSAIGGLLQTENPPTYGTLQVSLAVPYIDEQNRIVTIGNQNYNLSIPTDRKSLVSWYVQQIYNFKVSGNLRNVEVLGIYYHREDVIDIYGDIGIVQYLNEQVHNLGMKSVWVPYYNAPHAWDGKTLLGFDVLVVQPGYAFASSIDRGTALGDRLYAMGRKSSGVEQCYEYELRGGGEDPLEYWISHQYLAIAQSTSASSYPQVFFYGQDFFDTIVQNANRGMRWSAYTDLCNYLGGQVIGNLEVGVAFTLNAFQPSDNAGLVLPFNWTVPQGYLSNGINSIRLDFNDAAGYWRGRLVVKVPGQFSSFAQRRGPDIVIPDYSAVYVPLGNANITAGTILSIELHRDTVYTSWPSVIQMIAAIYENPYVTNPLYNEGSLASVMVQDGPHGDTVPTYKQWGTGKLTDGSINPGPEWWWDGVLGWTLIPEGEFSITIDLQTQNQEIKEVKIWSYFDQNASVREVTKLTALVSSNCPPKSTGTEELGCVPTASSQAAQFGPVDPLKVSKIIYNLTIGDGTTVVQGRYVTVSGVPLSWVLMDEIQVIDGNGNVVSTGKPYTVTPIPGNLNSTSPYPDTGRSLTDGAIFKKFIFGRGVVGMTASQEPNAQVNATWDIPQPSRCVRIWMTETDTDFGIVLPSSVTIATRDWFRQWSSVGANVQTQDNCGPSPCAALCFPNKLWVTGVQATFQNIRGWVMATEITIE